MFELLGIPPQALFGQLLLGLVNGSFYAILSLGLAVIFGLLNIINFAHGALYMVGAFLAYIGLTHFELDHLYGLLLTFGVALIIEGVFRYFFGVSGQPYPVPEALGGATDLGFMML